MTNKEFEVRWQLEVRVTRAIILHKRKQANKHSDQGQGHYHYQSGFPPNPKTNTDIFGYCMELVGQWLMITTALYRHLPKFCNKKINCTCLVAGFAPIFLYHCDTTCSKERCPGKAVLVPQYLKIHILVELTYTELQIQYQNPKSN